MASADLLWNLPAFNVTLAANEVHVWCVELDRLRSVIDHLSKLLSHDEQNRANQFGHEHLRCRYIVGRATLRRLLGEALRTDPAGLKFEYNAYGKPELSVGYVEKVHFNVSHSDDLALIAITRICPVGADLEKVRALRHDLQIAQRFFTARESTDLEALPEADRPAAFLSLWTRKEAWLKAKGVGIAGSMNRVEVSFRPGEPARVMHVADEPKESEKWTLIELNPAKGYTGALAIRASGVSVQCWRFQG